MISKLFSSFRHVSVVAVLFSFLGAIVLLIVGAKKTLSAIWDYFNGIHPEIYPEHVKAEGIIGSRILESMDVFLAALAFIYFGYAIFFLFMKNEKESVPSDMPSWLRPKSFGELKETLSHVLFVLLLVLAIKVIWLSVGNLTWELLVLPVSVVLLAVGIRVVGFTGQSHGD